MRKTILFLIRNADEELAEEAGAEMVSNFSGRSYIMIIFGKMLDR